MPSCWALAPPGRSVDAMSTHEIHTDHAHVHGPGCGHPAVRHEDHVDYLHDGHLHHPHGDHVDEHAIAEDDAHPSGHTEPASGDAPGHVHGEGCGHEPVPHGDHVDYLVGRALHHPHADHCDLHGSLEPAAG